MKLTGETSCDFATWYCNQDYDIHLIDFLELPLEFQWGVYQKFFNGHGIMIGRDDVDSYWLWDAIDEILYFTTRQEALLYACKSTER